MSPILPLRHIMSYKANVCFMDECGALQRVIQSFALQVVMSDLMEFAVDKWDKSIERLLIPTAPTHQ